MQNHILVSVDDYETRVAVLENSILAEYYFERPEQERLTGSIYKGRVTSIVEGIDAAFVDIGLERNGFLYVSDVLSPVEGEVFDILSEEADEDRLSDQDEMAFLPPPSICDVLKVGQEILVQVTKEPIGEKGCRVSTSLSLPGRHLVLLPITDHIGVSRKIDEPSERDRLRTIAKSVVPRHMGLIVRTAGVDRQVEDFKEDMRYLVAQWERINRVADSARAPALIHREMVVTHRLVRDMMGDDLSYLVVDSREMYDSLTEYIKATVLSLSGKVKFHDGPVPLFRSWGIEAEIAKLRQRKVWLSCGGYIVIDETESLTAIDVNSGKYTGDRNLEETVLTTNLESASEIARQLRLRDIGGIVVIDFIDMQKKENRELVLSRLADCLKRDRSRARILDLTRLGLVELTRKRVRKSLNRILTQPCPYCNSEGTILSFGTMMIRALRRLEALCEESTMKEIRLYLHPKLASRMIEERNADISRLEEKQRKTIRILPGPNLHFEDIRDGFSYDTASLLELT